MAAPYRIRKPLVAAVAVEERSGVATATVEGAGVAVAQPAASGNNLQEYLDRLMKMIPAEVIGLYLVGSGLIPAGQSIALVVWALVCLFAVVAVRMYGTYAPDLQHPIDWVHVGISTIAFVIWVYTLGGPFAVFSLYVPFIGSLLVLVWTFFVPIFYRGAD